MTRFSKQWETMSIEKQIDHLLADWKLSRETNDPLVLRVAATMAHYLLEHARDAIEQFRLSCEERGANWASHEHEMRDQIATLREERDEARRHLCDLYAKGQPTSSVMTDKDYAAELGWDCFKEPANAP
jgi:hypothetical protein